MRGCSLRLLLEYTQMDKTESAHPKCFLQCGEPLTKANSTKEHIILNAIGGRKTVSDFICKGCNDRSGSDWDAELAEKLNALSLLLGINRQRGEVPSQVFSTISGGQVELHPGGRMNIGIPHHEVIADGTGTKVKMTARSMPELRNMMKGLLRKYPSLRNQSLDDLMSTAQTGTFYSSDLTEYVLDFMREKAGKSLVKSAVALVFDAGIDPGHCDLAIDYLLTESGDPCFGYYYDKDRDLVTNRPRNKPFHCVCVKGDSDAGTILGYVEFYSLYRVVLCLSESYSGENFTNVYAIDPVEGLEIDIRIDLDLSIQDIRSIYRYEKFDDAVKNSAAASLFNYISAMDFDRALERTITDAVEYAFANCEAKQGEYLSDEELQQFIEDIFERMTPFLVHNAARFGFVAGGPRVDED